mgnify:CR=1 FL=1
MTKKIRSVVQRHFECENIKNGLKKEDKVETDGSLVNLNFESIEESEEGQNRRRLSSEFDEKSMTTLMGDP